MDSELAAGSDGESAPSTIFIEERVFTRTEFYNDWLKPIGQAEFATGMKLAQERSRLAHFAVHYDPKLAGTLHRPLSAILDALAPRLRRALDCNRVTARPIGAFKGMSLMETMIDPACLVNAERKLVDANQAAKGLLERRYPFRLALGCGGPRATLDREEAQKIQTFEMSDLDDDALTNRAAA